VSKFKDAFTQIEPMARRGISVVSSCEELLFPALREPELAATLDRVCKKAGARVVGTGVNPGFVMDLLPLCLTGVSREVSAIHVQRVVNASTRRAPLQKKIGSGLPPAEFRRRFKQGKAGHAGLKESLALIAHCLGWKVKNIVETGDAVVADHNIRTQFLEVKKGQTCGLHQYAQATVNGKVCLTLDIKMYLDAKNPHDAVQVEVASVGRHDRHIPGTVIKTSERQTGGRRRRAVAAEGSGDLTQAHLEDNVAEVHCDLPREGDLRTAARPGAKIFQRDAGDMRHRRLHQPSPFPNQ